jgi:putative NIF3 family GTP cyclohydrolase 1 type 2
MLFAQIKQNLLSQFDAAKIAAKPDEWGFLGDEAIKVRRVGYATNLTPQTVSCAAELGAQMLLTHHDAWEFVYGMKDACRAPLLKRCMAHAFFHAPLDDADFGTSASLAAALGLVNTRKIIPYEGIFLAGVMGELPVAEDGQAFARRLSAILQETIRANINDANPVRTVCVTTGAGHMSDDLRTAFEAGCDTYVTGEYGLYSQQYAHFVGMNLMVGSHTNTEILGVESLAKRLAGSTGVEIVRVQESND